MHFPGAAPAGLACRTAPSRDWRAEAGEEQHHLGPFDPHFAGHWGRTRHIISARFQHASTSSWCLDLCYGFICPPELSGIF